MIENVVVLELSVAVVVEVNANLLSGMDTVASQNGGAAGCDPDTSQSVGIDFILFNQSLAFLVHINSAVLAVVNLVMTYDGIRSSTDLDASEGIAINIIVLD